MNKPNCFTDKEWTTYQLELYMFKNGKTLDICKDCTKEYQRKMRIEGKCEFPMKRIDKIQEFV